mgnify:CR=1 FL=1
MDTTAAKAATELLVRHWKEGSTLAALPQALRPATRAEAYAAQAHLEAHSQQPLFGWKIAATSLAGQAHIGVSGPLAGRVLSGLVRRIEAALRCVSVESVDEARALANRIALLPPHSLRHTKNLLRQGQQTSYDTALELAANTQAMMHTTADHAEGVAALIEKRAAVFRGE